MIITAAAFFYALAAAAVLFVAYTELHPRLIIPTNNKVIYALLITFSLLLATRLVISICRSYKAKRTAVRICVAVLFIYYALILVNMLFFDAYFNRNASTGDWRHFYETNSNFNPFETIKLYMQSYRQETLDTSIIATNLLGNLLAFAPMGVFLPVLFRGMRRTVAFSFAVLVMVCSVEGIQFVTKVGSCDIDDVILNFSGALITFLIFKLPPLQRWLKRMY